MEGKKLKNIETETKNEAIAFSGAMNQDDKWQPLHCETRCKSTMDYIFVSVYMGLLSSTISRFILDKIYSNF